jgi:hypothetical protein
MSRVRLIRALLRYGSDGTPIDLPGDCRFYAVRVMNKDDHYASRAEEEEEKRERTSSRNRRNAQARYRKEREEPSEDCGGMPPQAMAGNTIPNQTNPLQNQTSPFQTNSISAESEQSSAAAPGIPLNDGSEFFAKKEDVEEWQQTYPAVDVAQELREMRAWCQANPKLRKTKNGVRRFIVAWLARQQDKGHPGMAVKPKPDRAFTPTEF